MSLKSINGVFGFVNDFIVKPILRERSAILVIFVSLLVLSASQGIFLLLIKGFLAAFFTQIDSDQVTVTQLVPDLLVKYFSFSESIAWRRRDLAFLVPIWIVIAGALKALAGYSYNVGVVRISLRIAQNFREVIFSHILALPWLKSAQRHGGEWMSVIMSDALFLQSRMSDFAAAFIKDLVLIVSCLATLAFIHKPAAIGLFLILPLIGWQMGKAGRKISSYTEAFQRELGLLAGRILAIRERFRYMKAQSGEIFEESAFREGNESYLKMMSGSIFLRAFLAPAMEFVGFGIFALFVFGWTRQLPGFAIEPEILIQFFVALGLVLRPIRELGEQVSRWGETVGGLRRSMALTTEVSAMGLNSELGLSSSIRTPDQFTKPLGKVRIDRVSIAYDFSPAFEASAMIFSSGQSIAIIGPSGSGKSSLVKCLAGLIPPSAWEANTTWENMAMRTAFVSQRPFLFNATFRDNLIYGLPVADCSDTQIWNALEIVNLDGLLKSLPSGLESLFNPVAVSLSGGQIQRFVIARAILRNPEIFILDEATSAVDVEAERDIISRLIANVKSTGKLLLSVTHRVGVLELYDRILFVESGQIQFSGSYQELCKFGRFIEFSSRRETES